ncbi:flavin reductase [Actinoplanes sp. ATCC 53533]|uniref:flavin reductase family protein n=1 Tax=Actinoplanes sp. ATCC 53533 TaxID=1288362 RepID=UPI000F78DE51|nr:flavin reductase family protein [Actinoplanes sp. ATCC 53533]RSM47507.1 flavin reductase [Actinoplanes sp. ATCC 53533]
MTTINQRKHAAGYDIRQLRWAFGAFATGVTVVTVGGREPHGMTANSFTSVSLDPPLVLVCVDRQAVMHERLENTGTFAVSILSCAQETVARHFADRLRPSGLAQFDDVGWRPGPATGAPLIDGALAHLECRLWRSYAGGDHTIFTGELVDLHRYGDDDPVLFLQGRFRQIGPERTEAHR